MLEQVSKPLNEIVQREHKNIEQMLQLVDESNEVQKVLQRNCKAAQLGAEAMQQLPSLSEAIKKASAML